MSSFNPVSSSWSDVRTEGDIGAMVNAFFAAKGNEAARKVKAAIGKAQQDANINKNIESCKNEMVQNGGETTVKPDGALYNILSSAGAKGDTNAGDLAAAVATGKLTADQYAAVQSFLSAQKDYLGGAGGVSDDSVNMTLVQIAFQEFNNAINGGSAAAKSTGDSKKSITDRM